MIDYMRQPQFMCQDPSFTIDISAIILNIQQQQTARRSTTHQNVEIDVVEKKKKLTCLLRIFRFAARELGQLRDRSALGARFEFLRE